MRVRVTGERTAEVFYDLDRGLPAENFGIPFGHVCAGVFLESLEAVAAGHGWEAAADLHLADMDFDSAERLHPIATITLAPREATEADRARLLAFRSRRTNRRPYEGRAIDPGDLDVVASEASAAGHVFATTTDPGAVEAIIRVNQETLFDDLRNDAVHGEIMEWLRFSEPEAIARGDGLSAATMLMPGRILRFAMGHRGLWEAPVIGAAIRAVYLRTMRGVTQVAWWSGPFASPGDYLAAGRVFLSAWLDLTARGVALHPFGTVITNPRSHARFVDLVDADESEGRMAWMLVRIGYAKQPPVAHRRPVEEMLA